jgi:hypothetical protein
MWWTMMTILQDEDTQRNGMVGINLNLGPDPIGFEDLAMMRVAHRALSGLPVKVPGLHFCYDDYSLLSLVAFIRCLPGKRMRQQIRSHFGTCFTSQNETALEVVVKSAISSWYASFFVLTCCQLLSTYLQRISLGMRL